MTTTLKDMEEGLSECCGAQVYLSDICSDCKEHCSLVYEEEPFDYHESIWKIKMAQIIFPKLKCDVQNSFKLSFYGTCEQLKIIISKK